jgi:hypothetical protein
MQLHMLPTHSDSGVDVGVKRKPTAKRTTSRKIEENSRIRKMFTFFKAVN